MTESDLFTIEHLIGTRDEDCIDIVALVAEIRRLRAEVEHLHRQADAGYELSTYAAAIHWDGSPNEPEWLTILRERIERVQALAKQGNPNG